MSAGKLRLFHKIGDGGAESATVRAYIVEHDLAEWIEFSNIAYEGAQKDLRELTGALEAPVLVVQGRPVQGKAAILDWFRQNQAALKARR